MDTRPLSLARFKLFRQHLITPVFSAGILLSLLGSGQGEELRYRWEPKQKFSYSIAITIDENDKTTTFQGMTHYEVTAANAEQLKVTYRGGLPEQVKTKQNNRASVPFGPRGLGPFGPRGIGGPPSPFSRPTFAGKVRTTNQIVMTPAGRVLSMEGDSHLPYLIGNVSLLPFEPLPKGEQTQWVVDSGVSISEETENDRSGFGPRGSFGPFGAMSDRESKSVQAATEVTRYNIENQQNNLVSIRKSYQLTSPGNDEESFEMSGAGIWVFDKAECVPHSLDLTAKLIAREGNSSTTFPITMKVTRVTAAELAKLEAEAKQAAEEMQRKTAEAKAQAEAPLTSAEKQAALAALSSKDQSRMLEYLGVLKSKSPLETDPEVAAAIAELLKHADNKVVEEARQALVKWSPQFKRKFELNKAYEGPGAMASSELEVESSTPLYIGQIIQYQEHGSFWFAGRIKQLLPDKKVLVESLAWGKPNRELTVSHRNLQLAPAEVDQPARSSAGESIASSSNSSSAVEIKSEMRTWTDKSGRFRLEATFVSEENGSIKLLRKDGKPATVPLDKLSDADQAFIRQMLDENPFEVGSK